MNYYILAYIIISYIIVYAVMKCDRDYYDGVDEHIKGTMAIILLFSPFTVIIVIINLILQFTCFIYKSIRPTINYIGNKLFSDKY